MAKLSEERWKNIFMVFGKERYLRTAKHKPQRNFLNVFEYVTKINSVW